MSSGARLLRALMKKPRALAHLATAALHHPTTKRKSCLPRVEHQEPAQFVAPLEAGKLRPLSREGGGGHGCLRGRRSRRVARHAKTPRPPPLRRVGKTPSSVGEPRIALECRRKEARRAPGRGDPGSGELTRPIASTPSGIPRSAPHSTWHILPCPSPADPWSLPGRYAAAYRGGPRLRLRPHACGICCWSEA